ncbi:hypothetical protein M7775_13575 [Sporomusa sphaeroides DSM 2875]|uniref:hypothetical protein n=1 Tax=Sporomusa sphaeroides TaxID=47679 RepID=UPI002030D848|nr:hypothetical protein [Sporomusa sphaeroides]MCM0759583.1 hypothetical protein [Sporomusa sphaeroides DSM 2875]
MDAKITPEQAIDVIEYAIAILVHADCTARDIMNLQHTIELIKALAQEAELGRAAVKAIGNKSPYPCQYPLFIDGSSICKMCTWTDFCRLRAGKEAGE